MLEIPVMSALKRTTAPKNCDLKASKCKRCARSLHRASSLPNFQEAEDQKGKVQLIGRN